MSSEHKMDTGALVFMDALGFKGVWKRKDVADDPTRVIRKLETAELETREALAFENDATLPKGKALELQAAVHVAFISDTVVVAVSQDAGPLVRGILSEQWAGREVSLTLLLACEFAAGVIQRMAESPAPLAMRGCVTWGQFAVSPSFVVGPAVDEAAECAALAEAAVVWFAPSALAQFAWKGEPPFIIPWSVPMKGGASYRTHCVSPFTALGPAKAEKLAGALVGAFDVQRLDVQIKRQQTQHFLEYASRKESERTAKANARGKGKKP